MPEEPLTGAQVCGWAAVALVQVLDDRLRQLELVATRRDDIRVALPDVRRTFAAIRQAARQHGDWVRSASGLADLVAADMPPQSTEIDTAEASALLGITDRQVRRLAAAKVLVGRKHGTAWVLDRLSVATYSREEAGDARCDRGAGAGSAAQPG